MPEYSRPQPRGRVQGSGFAHESIDSAPQPDILRPPVVVAPSDPRIMTLRVQQLASVQDFDSIAEAWDRLEGGLWPRLPFQSRLWNQLWWQHLRRNGTLRVDEFFVHVVWDRRRLVAVAPLMITNAPGWGPWRVRKLHFFGADPNLTEVRGMICQPADEARALQALTTHIAMSQQKWGLCHWSGLRQDSRIANMIKLPGSMEWLAPIEDYYLRLPTTWPEYRSSLSRNTKEALRKCTNSLKRDGLSYQFRVISAPADVAAAIERFLPLHRQRAQADLAVQHVNCFEDSHAQAFLHDYARHMAAQGALQVFELEAAGRVVASRIGFSFGPELYLYYSGYDLTWGKYSIMTTLVSEILQWAIGQKYQLVNLSTGTDRSKLRWKPDRVVFHRLEVGDRASDTGLQRRVLQWGQQLRQRSE